MEIDNYLIESCKKNDRKAQEQLYKKIFPYMMGICYRYTLSKDLSKEIVNTAMYKVLTQIQNYNSSYPFKVWVSKITVNTIIDDFRKNKKNSPINYVEEYTDNSSFSDVNEALSKFSVNEILHLIEQLDETEKKVFNLHCIDEYSHEEISNMLGIPVGTSKWFLNQARKKLQQMIKKMYSKI